MTPRLTNIAADDQRHDRAGRDRAVDAHHIRRIRLLAADGTAHRVGAVLHETHMAWAPAPFERRSSAAVSRSSIPPYNRAYEPISSLDSPTARCRPLMITAMAAIT
jgi:hypothetical protein